MNSMRMIGAIASNQLLRVAKDGSVFWLFALPLLIIYVLGVTLQSAFGGGFAPASPYPVTVSAHGAALEESILGRLEGMTQYFIVARERDDADARRSVLERETSAAVIVPEAFPDEPVVVVAEPGSTVGGILAEVIRGAMDSPQTEAMTEERKGAGPLFPQDAMQYYAAGIMVFFAMFAAHTAMVNSAGEKSNDTYLRTRALGVSRATYVVGGFVSAALICCAFVLAMSVTTALLFGVSWGDPIAWLVLSLAGAVGLAALSFFISAVLPAKKKVVESAGSVIFSILAFMGGSTVPLPVLPGWFTEAFDWFPNRTMLDGYFVIGAGGTLGDIGENLAVLAVTALGLSAVAWVLTAAKTKEEA